MDLKKVAISMITAGAIMYAAIAANAASGKCTVVETEGDRLVIECPEQGSQFKAGDAIKIKSAKKTSAVEGC